MPESNLVVDRANRLSSLKASPGWNDFVRIGQGVVAKAQDQASRFEGWDPQQALILLTRSKVALEFWEQLLSEIFAGISDGIVESAVSQPNTKEAVVNADQLREEILSRAPEEDNSFCY